MQSWLLKLGGYDGFKFIPAVAEKAPYIIKGLVYISIFLIIFTALYYWRFRKDNMAKRLFLWTGGILFLIVLAKYAMNYLTKGSYITERLIIYGLPSPRAQSLFWFVLPSVIFFVFLFFRKKIEGLPRWKFLSACYLFFCLFAISVDGIRGGFASIIDPLNLNKVEYSGNIKLIESVKYFVENYVSLIPKLASHSTTHPPGYSLVLYFFHKVFHAGLLGQAVLLVFSAGLAMIPLFYLWSRLFAEKKARRILEIFIFTPSVVMFTATSMDALMMLIAWTAIVLCYFGWRKNIYLSALGGIAAGCALFSNFLFMLLAPAFLLILLHVLKIVPKEERSKILLRALFSLGSFLLFFAGLYFWAHYSFFENLFAARIANQHAVKSNFESLGKYLTYFFMNIIAFFVYLGLPFIYLMIRGGLNGIKKSNWLFKIGLVNLFFLLVVGVFQGEIERIWLFMVPFFVIGENSLADDEGHALFAPFFLLTFFQIMIIQVLFFTYW